MISIHKALLVLISSSTPAGKLCQIKLRAGTGTDSCWQRTRVSPSIE
jgi:hypothetical protein